MRPMANVKHIKPAIVGASGSVSVSFTGTGPADYTYQVGDGSGLCEICHTTTAHYKSDGSGTAHYTADCLSCHDHAGGIPIVSDPADAPHGSVTCDECHNGISDRNLGATLDNAKCLACHGPGQSATLAAEHQAPLASDCTDCHNVMRAQSNAKHIKGTVNGQSVSFTGTGPADYTYAAGDGSGLCEVCHTATAHYQSDGIRYSSLRR